MRTPKSTGQKRPTKIQALHDSIPDMEQTTNNQPAQPDKDKKKIDPETIKKLQETKQKQIENGETVKKS